MSTNKLRREHGAAQYVLNRLEVVAGDLENLPQVTPDQMVELTALLGFMTRFDRCHCLKTEEALLPALEERHVDVSGTVLALSCYEHARLCTMLNKLKRRLPRIMHDVAGRTAFVELAREYIEGTRQHMLAADQELEELETALTSDSDKQALHDALARYEQDNKWLSGTPLLLEPNPGRRKA